MIYSPLQKWDFFFLKWDSIYLLRLYICRRFGNMVDALAHKMLLESLGRGSVKKMIREMNPQYINLAE